MAPMPHRATPVRLAALALALSLAGCTWTSSGSSSDNIDYKGKAAKTQPLDVPPDLTQLAREGRYQPQAGGAVSATAMKSAGGASSPVASSGPVVAPSALGDVRVLRDGQQRWLVSSLPPEKLYPLVRSFWVDRGFVLVQDSPELGLLETDWAENRAKLPDDFIRNTIGRVFDKVFDTGERDRYRTRIERTATGSEVYISHRGLIEVATGVQKDTVVWQNRPSDPQLEAEFLARLMVRLGSKDEAVAKADVAAAEPARAASAAAAPASTRAVLSADGKLLALAENFERGWRQVGLALDRGGFTVEDRDRSAGLYFVRYADPKLAGQEEPNFFAKLFSKDSDNLKRLQRYRVVVKATGDKTQISVLTGDGGPDSGEASRVILGKLQEALR